MKNPLSFFTALPVLAILLFTGCATGFRPIQRDALGFVPNSDSASLPVQYRFNVLDDSRNPRYANKARMNGLQFVAVKVTNNQTKPLVMKTDVTYYVGNAAVAPTEIRYTVPVVRQRTGAYAFYLLLMLLNGQKTTVNCDYYSGCSENTTFIPIGVIIGPAIAIGNMALAAGANDAFEKEFVANDLFEKVLQPGETATGYLALRGVAPAPLSIRPR